MPSGNIRRPSRTSAALGIALLVLVWAVSVQAATLVPENARISDYQARLALARLLAQKDADLERAAAQYRILVRQKPGDKALAKELEQMRTRLSPPPAKAPLPGQPPAPAVDQTLEQARERFYRGDFYGAEQLLRPRAAQGDRPAALLLAEVLDAGQRHAEAEAVLEGLLRRDAGDRDARLAMARSLLRQERPGEVLAALSPLPQDDAGAVLLRARAMRRQGRQAEALALLERAPVSTERLLERGRILRDLGREAEARAAFAEAARLAPDDAEAAYEAAGDERTREAFVAALVAREKRPEALLRWASLYSRDGAHGPALRCIDAALALDPKSFQAREAHAETLAWSGDRDASLRELQALDRDFPGNFKVLLAQARTFSWNRQYDESLATYARLRDLDPSDPVPLREAARVAYWGKMPEQGAELYAAGARLQPEAAQEGQAKALLHDGRFIRALHGYEELTAAEPANQEALFDQGQAACVLGLCDQEREAYDRLLDLDPLHGQAGLALRRLEVRQAPAVTAGGEYWREDGHGDLSRIERLRFDAGLSAPLGERFRMRLTQHLWLDSPERESTTYDALGQTLGLGGVVNEYLRLDASWTNKRYNEHGLDNLDTGRARLEFNLDDLARVGVGWERQEELANGFALRKGMYSDNVFLDAAADLTRKLDVSAEVRGKDYRDGNSGDSERLALGYAFTDHPRKLRLLVSGERRDTKTESLSIYTGGTLTDIVHPYWTPQDYYAGWAELQWEHDLSKEFFCGAEKHQYGLALGGGTDTEENPAVRVSAHWRYEFLEGWSLETRGLMHRSPQWDADSLALWFSYAFTQGGRP